MREWLWIWSKSMEGIMSEPVVAISLISERREERRRDQEATMAGAWGSRRDCFMDAKRAGKGVASVPEREAKTEEISPSFRGPRPREADVCVAVAMVRENLRGFTPRWVRRVESIMAALMNWSGDKESKEKSGEGKRIGAYLYTPAK